MCSSSSTRTLADSAMMLYRLFSIPLVSFSMMLSVRLTIRWLTSGSMDPRTVFAKTVNISLFGMEIT